jgi:predicted PurR-regulated permease PerM
VAVGTSYAKNIGNMAVNLVGSFFSFVTQTSIVLTLSVLFSIQKDAVMKFIARLGGEKKYKFIYMKLERIYKRLGIWLKSQLLLCIFIGAAMYAALWILAIFGIDLPQK